MTEGDFPNINASFRTVDEALEPPAALTSHLTKAFARIGTMPERWPKPRRSRPLQSNAGRWLIAAAMLVLSVGALDQLHPGSNTANPGRSIYAPQPEQTTAI